MLKTFSDIQSPFALLRRQLKDIEPGDTPIDMTIGAPSHPAPSFVSKALVEQHDTLGKYPAITGSDELRTSITGWAYHHFERLAGHISEANCLPLNGSREGLFYAIFIAKARRSDIKDPLVLMPNPFYQVYGAAALAANATPVFLNATAENGFLPDLEKIDQETANRAIAFYLCSPSNPEGAVANLDYLAKAIRFAQSHNLMLFADECYSEIYRAAKPPSALEAALVLNGNLDNVAVFNSLSKRSNVPGLRSGCVIANQQFIEEFTQFRNVAGPQMPGPIQHVSARLWQDEAHVIGNRALYNKKFDLALSILNGRFSVEKPPGGFFLWLNMSEYGDGIAATTTLWKDCGVKLLPGAYLAQSDQSGENPGLKYVRAALVGSIEQTEEALTKIVRVL